MTTSALAVQQPAAPAIAVAPPSFAQPRSLAEVKQVAELMLASGFFKDVKSMAQACVKIMAGLALGYDVTTSMNAFHIIEGKIAPTAGEIAARIKRSGKYNFKLAKAMTNDEVSLMFMERDGDKWMELGESSFTKADAVIAGVASKDVWKKYPRNMLWARALSNGARWFTADVFGGPVYTAEELGANVDVIDGEIVVLETTQEPPAPSATPARPPSGDEIKTLYADARKLHPALPENIREWMASAVPSYDVKRNPVGREMLEAHAKLTELLANGVAPVESDGGAEEADKASGGGDGATTAAVIESSPSDAPPLARSVSYVNFGTPKDVPFPEHDGSKISMRTRGTLFGNLQKLGITTGGRTKDEEERDRKHRFEWVEQMSGGFVITSFNDLSQPQAEWLEKRSHDDLRAILPCAACNADLARGDSHSKGCPENIG